MNYGKLNNIAGWVVGVFATIIYLVTMEPTASYWDCGEFLACAYKLEVGHSPGAPFFMMIQRIFGIFAPGKEYVAAFINAWSAIASGLTILFLFWTITHLAKKLIIGGGKDNENVPSRKHTVLIIGAGLVGALAYTFSDTFWFSAVEAEVYATSSLFTALSFWAMLKWEAVADRRYADRWLLLISFLIGISVGIHLLNLLTIPALAIIYYFRRYEVTPMGTVIAFVLGCAALGLVQFGVIQGVTILASAFDVFFVNTLGMPFDSGALVAVVVIIAIVAALIVYARKTNRYLLHTGMLCLVFVLLGFSSYIVPMIRSRADVPIDMTNPDNTLSLVSYVTREQFGEQPLLYGPDFDAGNPEVEDKGDKYAKSVSGEGKDYYEVVGHKRKYKYDPAKCRFFPRIYDGNDAGHRQFYRQFLGLAEDESPSGADNMKYFFGYQMNWMWWRYFMWNYAGRQNDFEGQGEAKNGNWISGIKPIDKFFGRGDLDKLPDGYRNNPARNQLYFLPLILGILGVVYQFNRSKRDGFVVATLFFFTGIAIGIYLNMPPLQPRERDYAFAGATYAFAIWIGLGVLMVYEWLDRRMKGEGAAWTATLLCLLLVPAWMAKENWDDHNRHKKILARATAYNALQSCAPNAVLFTYGDNETYPLWYLQEIEEVRKDVRVINTSLLGIDWYVDQLNYRINDADAIPMMWKREDYLGERREVIYYIDKSMRPDIAEVSPTQFFPIADICKFIVSGPKVQLEGGDAINYLPTRNIFIPTPAKGALGALSVGMDTTRLSTDMRITFSANKNYYSKSDLAQINIIAANAAGGWTRPIYFSSLQETEGFGNLNDFMKLEGNVYRLMPYKMEKIPGVQEIPGQGGGFVDLEKSFKLFTQTFQWGNANRSDVYFDEKNRQNFITYRLNAARLADELVAAGRKDDAVSVLEAVRKGISERSYHYDFTALYMAQAYYHAGAQAQASAMTKKVVDNARDDLRYIGSLGESGREASANEAQRDMQIIGQMAVETIKSGDSKTTDYIMMQLQSVAGSGAVDGAGLQQMIQQLQQMRSAQQSVNLGPEGRNGAPQQGPPSPQQGGPPPPQPAPGAAPAR